MSHTGSYNGDDDLGGTIITEINVTPMVDIMLVLLIIFMVTASLIVSPAMKVELPKGTSKGTMASKEPDLVIVINREGGIQYKDRQLKEDQLLVEMNKDFKEKPGARVLILADRKSYHGNVVKVMDIAKSVGFVRLGVAIDTAQN